MENNTLENNTEITIDLVELLGKLWAKKWLLLISTAACGLIVFLCTQFIVPPKYQAEAMMYVNNTLSQNGANTSITSGEITAAKSLLDTYVVILKSPTTLESILERSKLDVSQKKLKEMISASDVDSTEIFKITVTSTDPAEAKLIADTIVEVLPDRIASIVDGSSVRVVDYAKLPTAKSSPNVMKLTIIGLFAGLVLACAFVTLTYILDYSIHSEEYLTETFGLPILAVVPNSEDKSSDSYNYYK